MVSDRSADYSTAILASNPVGYWRLDDAAGSGTVVDVTGNHPGSYSGSIQKEQPGIFEANDAIRFEGNGYVTIADDAALKPDQMTLEAWVEIGDLDSATQTILYKGGHRIYRQGNLLRAYFYNSETTRDVYTTLLPNRWIHIAATYDGSVSRLYVNGNYVSGRTLNAPLSHGTQPLRLGSTGSNTWQGGMDEVAFYERALSAEEIAAHYAASLTKSPVRVELIQESTGVTVATLGEGILGRKLNWTIPETLPSDQEYRLRVTSEVGTRASDLSHEPFVIANGGTSFYVNLADDTDLSDNQYTTAAGDNRASGKRPNQPLSSIQAVLDRYNLEPGDTIYVDTGTYRLAANIAITGNDSGVTIQGPTDNDKIAVLDRGRIDDSTAVFDLLGADSVSIIGFDITGAYQGVWIRNGQSSDRLSLIDNHIYGNSYYGVFSGDRSANGKFQGNRVHDNGQYGFYLRRRGHEVTGNEVYAQRTGITLTDGGRITSNTAYGNEFGISVNAPSGSAGLVENNRVYQNTDTGIDAQGAVEVLRNEVFAHQGGAVAISVLNGVVARDNVVYGNDTGISLQDGLVDKNRVFNNTIGIDAVSGTVESTKIHGNQVYSNSTGVQIRGPLSVNTGDAEVTNNLIYANTNNGVYFGNARDSRVLNNTIYHPVGSAVIFSRDSRGFEVSNNIIIVEAGTALSLSNATSSFWLDHNLYRISDGAKVGHFNGYQTTLQGWQVATGQEQHSLIGDPQFVDIDGADNVLGWSPEAIDGGEDDNFFRLANSVAIDRGYSWTGIARDIAGRPRLDDPGVTNSGSPDYARVELVPELAVPSGAAQGWKTSTGIWSLPLPFAFPFYGGSYESVQVSTEGFLDFSGTTNPHTSQEEFFTKRRIAPLWSDLTTTPSGKDIYVDDSTAGRITIRWEAANQADGSDVSFAVTLFESGNIRFDHDRGNLASLDPLIGISAGDGRNFLQIPIEGVTDLGSLDPIELTLVPGFIDIGAYEFRGDSRDGTPPTIEATLPAAIDAQGLVIDPLDRIEVVLSEPVNELDANSDAAYSLVTFGADGLFGSTDDVAIPLTPDYTAGAERLTLRLDEVLPPGGYRLTVFGSTTFHDLAGVRLDGDGDAQAGGDYVRDFSVFANKPPTAESQTVVIDEDMPVVITLAGDDGDAEVDQPLTFLLTSLPEQGELRVTADGPAVTSSDLPLALPGSQMIFTPAENQNASQQFRFVSFDHYGETPSAENTSPEATITVDLNPIPDPPSIPDRLVTIPESVASGTVIARLDVSDADLGQATSDQHRFAIVSGNEDGSFAINDNGEISVSPSHQIDFESAAFRLLVIEATDAADLSDTAEVRISIQNVAEPEIESVKINGGESQRSAIKRLTITFNQVVEIADGDAFRLTNRETGEVVEDVPAVAVVDGRTVVELEFLPGPSVATGGSLLDGSYELVVEADLVSGSGLALDGNADGATGDDYLFGSDAVDTFYRKYGDDNGDGTVDLVDFAAFRRTFGSAVGDERYLDHLDADGSGTIDLLDFASFRRNFGK